jgi:hypothetical protein
MKKDHSHAESEDQDSVSDMPLGNQIKFNE